MVYMVIEQVASYSCIKSANKRGRGFRPVLTVMTKVDGQGSNTVENMLTQYLNAL